MAIIIYPTSSETFFAQASDASAVDDSTRTFKRELARGIGEFMYWPGSAASQGNSAASTGEMLAGTARVGINDWRAGPGAAGTRAGGQPNGVVFHGQDQGSSSLPMTDSIVAAHIGENPFVFGGSHMMEHATSVATTERWLAQEGEVEVSIPDDDTVDVTVDFPITYGSWPLVFLSVESHRGLGNNYGVYASVLTASAERFTSRISLFNTLGLLNPLPHRLIWRSEGTLAYA